MTCPSIFISLRPLMPFEDYLRSRYSLTTAYRAGRVVPAARPVASFKYR